MKLVIIAGGKGTRLGLENIPKPMVMIGERPLLEHQISNAKRYGIKDIYILTYHLSSVIEEYFGDGTDLGVNITYIKERLPLGTAGALKQLEIILDDKFMVFYGDIIFDLDLASFQRFDRSSPSIATIVVHPNDHPFDSDLVEIDENNFVVNFHSKPHRKNSYFRNLVNAAVYIMDPKIFNYIPGDKPSDFGKDIFPLLLKSNEKIHAYNIAEYIKDIGTPARLEIARTDYLTGTIQRHSKRHKRAAIFIDRDGTLIENVDLLHCPKDLRLFPYSAQAVKSINNSDYMCFIVTNQPVVARNLCNIATVKEIHNKLETLIGREGAYLNGIYFCPHHPDKGYPEENAEFKIDCACRKPKTKMILEAANEFNIDLKSSWIIGDTTTDILTGLNAGLKTVLVKTGKAGKDQKYQCKSHYEASDIRKAVDLILKRP